MRRAGVVCLDHRTLKREPVVNRVYWRISRLPELEHLAEADREALLRQAVPGVTSVIVTRSLAGGLPVGILAALVTESVAHTAAYSLAVLLAASLAGSVVAYQVVLIHIRGQLLTYLEKTARQQQLPMCLYCGYNLAGLKSGVCPECGRPRHGPPGT